MSASRGSTVTSLPGSLSPRLPELIRSRIFKQSNQPRYLSSFPLRKTLISITILASYFSLPECAFFSRSSQATMQPIFVHFCFLGELKAQTTNLKLNDNKWHKVHLTRVDRVLTITIDDGLASCKSLSDLLPALLTS